MGPTKLYGNKNQGIENKIIFGDFNVLWIKWTWILKIKHKDVIDDVLIMPCVNSSGIMGLRIYGQGSRIDRVYTDIKVANNTKINHIMVSSTDDYNAISIDRLPSKKKIGEYSWFFSKSLLYKLDFSSAAKTFLFLLKTQKNNHSSGSDWWKYTKSWLKKNAKIFSVKSTTQGNINNFKTEWAFLLKIQ